MTITSEGKAPRIRRSREEKMELVAQYDALPTREEKHQWLDEHGFNSLKMAQWRTATTRPAKRRKAAIKEATKDIPHPTPAVISRMTGTQPTSFDHDPKAGLTRLIAKHELILQAYRAALTALEGL